MRAVVLDGTPSGHDECRQGADALLRALSDEGHAVETYHLAELPMAPCRGCFACWTVTPGECPVGDASQVVARAFVQAELAVVYSPVRFGVWGFEAKKALDRMICLISPHFDGRGVTRHRARYNPMPSFLGVGWLPGPAREAREAADLFGKLVEHNAYNLRAPTSASVVLTGDKPWAFWRETCLKALVGLAPAGGR